MKRTAVINVVGLCEALIGPRTPRIAQFLAQGAKASIAPAFPAVTCTAQSNYLTGTPPSRHGIVANGWYDRESAETRFWRQSNHLVAGLKIWEQLRQEDPKFTCAKLFWWHNMHSTADYSITPRPMYPADGRKVFDIYTSPGDIREEIQRDLGAFPFAAFWGPAAGVDTPQGSADAASRWIAESAKWIENKYSPTLNLVYLPHLDYNLQRHGPAAVQTGKLDDLARIDEITGDLISFFQARGVGIILLSEYAIKDVDTPVHLNRLFRHNGWLAVREELGLETLDCGASRAFAVSDHQAAHIYINDPSIGKAVREALENAPGVETILDAPLQKEWGVDHPRSGDLIAVARDGAWFTYYHWLENSRAPDYARCVDIHRKPGFDPVELFLDPNIPMVKLKILWRLMQKRMGFRMLMDVIPLDATLVKGSHGRRGGNPADWPVLICESPKPAIPARIDSTDVCEIIKNQIQHSH